MFGTKKSIFERLIESNRNVIINGDISSGKTSNIIFPLIDKIINNDESFLFLDSKEEYINKYYGYLKNKDYNIITINLHDPDRTDGYNVFEYPYELYKRKEYDKAIEYLESIAQNIFFDHSANDQFWLSSCQDLFIGVSLLLFEMQKEEQINFNSINYLYSSNILKTIILKLNKTSNIYNCLSGTVLAPSETKGGILSTFKQKIRKIISKEKINNLLAKTTFDINKIVNEKTAVFIIARDDNKDINIIASIIIEQIFKIIFDSQKHYKYNFVLDNIDTIHNIENLSNMLSSGIARDIKFIIGTRSLDDFNKNYSEYIEKLSNILSISDRHIETMIDNKYEKIRYILEPYNYPKDNINYPILSPNNTNEFSQSDFLRNIALLNMRLKKENESDNDGILKKASNPDNPFTKNPFINEKKDNLFTIYEDNKTKNKDNYTDELIKQIDAKIEELEKNNSKEKETIEDNNISNEIKDDHNKDNNQINAINKKIKELEQESTIIEQEKEDIIVKQETSTEDLLKMIDEKISELEKNEKEDSSLDETSSKNMDFINNDTDNKEFINIFPELETKKESFKPKVKNQLAHYNIEENIEKQIEEELEAKGFIKYIDEKKYYMNGYKKNKEKLLKEKYNINKDRNSIF